MKTKILILAIIFFSCKEKTKPIISKNEAIVSISADSIIAKFKTTAFRKMKFNDKIYNYIDTTFKGELFVIKDTITEIRIDNTGNKYIVLGKVKNNENVKCYFENNTTVDSLKPKQVITVSSKRHAARSVSAFADASVKVLVVELGFCSVVK